MPVSTIASLVPNSPLCLPLDQACDMLNRGDISIPKEGWSQIMHIIVKAATLLNAGDLMHGDFLKKNMNIIYRDGRYKLSVLDFDTTCDMEDAEDDMQDVNDALDIVQGLATLLSMTRTKTFIAQQSNFSLRRLREEMNKDLRR